MVNIKNRFLSLALVFSSIFIFAFRFSATRGIYYQADEWKLLSHLNAGQSNFLPENEHLMVIPKLIYQMALAISPLHTPRLIITTSLLVHFLACYIIYFTFRQKITYFGALLIFCLMLNLRGSENMLWGFQIAWTVQALFVALLSLLMNYKIRSNVSVIKYYLISVILIASALTNGLYISICSFIIVYSIILKNYRIGAATFPSIILFLAWWNSPLGKQVSRQHFNPNDWEGNRISHALQYFINGSLHAFISLGWAPIAILVFSLLGASINYHELNLFLSGVLLSVPYFSGLFVFILVNAFGRSQYGSNQSNSSRYLYFESFLIVIIVLHFLNSLPDVFNSSIRNFMFLGLTVIVLFSTSVNDFKNAKSLAIINRQENQKNYFLIKTFISNPNLFKDQDLNSIFTSKVDLLKLTKSGWL